MPLLDKLLVEFVVSIKETSPIVSKQLTGILHDWAESETISMLLPYGLCSYIVHRLIILI